MLCFTNVLTYAFLTVDFQSRIYSALIPIPIRGSVSRQQTSRKPTQSQTLPKTYYFFFVLDTPRIRTVPPNCTKGAEESKSSSILSKPPIDPIQSNPTQSNPAVIRSSTTPESFTECGKNTKVPVRLKQCSTKERDVLLYFAVPRNQGLGN